MSETVLLFKKNRKKEDGSTYPTYFATSVVGQSITARLTDNAKADIIKSNIDFPLEVEVNEDDYFITTETYVDAKGDKKKLPVCVFQGFSKISKAIVNKKSLTDFFNEQLNVANVDMPE